MVMVVYCVSDRSVVRQEDRPVPIVNVVFITFLITIRFIDALCRSTVNHSSIPISCYYFCCCCSKLPLPPKPIIDSRRVRPPHNPLIQIPNPCCWCRLFEELRNYMYTTRGVFGETIEQRWDWLWDPVTKGNFGTDLFDLILFYWPAPEWVNELPRFEYPDPSKDRLKSLCWDGDMVIQCCCLLFTTRLPDSHSLCLGRNRRCDL